MKRINLNRTLAYFLFFVIFGGTLTLFYLESLIIPFSVALIVFNIPDKFLNYLQNLNLISLK
ncbi:MAG: hypothetical protein ACRC1T_04525 [Clostridium chrysemydis]|uniref:hypothetical protein n=1 Tax=Clostridium chrysemydis TaxID=2665504 RepID=UPI003F3BCA12